MSTLFSTPAQPKLPDPVKAPDARDPAVREAASNKIRKAQATGGRESTFLEQPPSYSGKQLGG